MELDKLGRRDFLSKVLAPGMAFGAAALSACSTPLEQEQFIQIYTGLVEIRKGLTVRNSTRVTYPRELPNVVDWYYVRSINGKDISKAERFAIRNPQIVFGRNPDNYLSIEPGIWLKFGAQVASTIPLLGYRSEDLYISISNATKDYYNIPGDFRQEIMKNLLLLANFKAGRTRLRDGQIIEAKDIGVVYPL